MPDLNKVLLMGRLTRDPELRKTPSGMAVAEASLAINRRYRSSPGEDREEVCFVNVTVWGKSAEAMARYTQKGATVLVEGRLKLDEWEKDGQKRSRLGVVAERVQFLGSTTERTERADAGQTRPETPTDDPPAPEERPHGSQPATGAEPNDDDLPF